MPSSWVRTSVNAIGVLVAALEISAGSAPASMMLPAEAALRRHVRHFKILPLPWFPRTETGEPQQAELQAPHR